jgi:hypothetical protein
MYIQYARLYGERKRKLREGGAQGKVQVDSHRHSSAKDLPSLQASYSKEIAAVDPVAIFAEMKFRIEKCIQDRDLPGLLSVYDNKGLLAEGAAILRLRNRSDLQDLTARLIASPTNAKLREALARAMPEILA